MESGLTSFGRGIFTLWLALSLVFVLLRLLPGDSIAAGLRPSGATEAQIAAERTRLGLDDPLLLQYGRYLAGLPRGDWGTSLVTREAVLQMILDRLPATLQLAFFALFLGTVAGLALGSGAVFSRWLEGLIYLLLATPVYWLATVAIYLASYPWQALALRPYLPPVVLGISLAGGIGRVVMSALGETFAQSYLQTARAKGLGPLGLYYHALRASLPPILSLLALQAGFLLSGTVIIEMMFTRRGLGSLLHQAVLTQDYPVVQGVILVSAGLYFATQNLAEVLRKWADPRVG